jgi:hypothetical protein
VALGLGNLLNGPAPVKIDFSSKNMPMVFANAKLSVNDYEFSDTRGELHGVFEQVKTLNDIFGKSCQQAQSN